MGMVVRTNTMALNAYRQLGMNNNAVTKSLEKLSSGFRINRAGDDAAGLAISEKMKAQITGLETASANAQDGISLIQTAEGNLNEVHSMLNRMVELATKSANGTYTQTERDALQDEVDSLLEEIDRISQSANFNGTNLLDGSLGSVDPNGSIQKITTNPYRGGGAAEAFTATFVTDRPAAATEQTMAKFTVSFDDRAVSNASTGDVIELTIGDRKLSYAVTDGDVTNGLSASDLAAKFAQVGVTNGSATSFAGGSAAAGTDNTTAAWNAGPGTAAATNVAAAANKFVQIEGHWYEMSANGNGIDFTQVDHMGKTGTEINPDYAVKIELGNTISGSKIDLSGTENWQVQKPTSGIGIGAVHQAQATVDIDFSKIKEGDKLTVGDVNYTFSFATNANSGSGTNITIGLKDILGSSEDFTDKDKLAKAMTKIVDTMGASTLWSAGNSGVSGTKGTITFQSLSSYTDEASNIGGEASNGKAIMKTESDVMAQFYSKASTANASASFDLDVTKLKAGDRITIDGRTFEFTDGVRTDDPDAIAIDLSSFGIGTGSITKSDSNKIVDTVKTALGTEFGSKFNITADGNTITVEATTNGTGKHPEREVPSISVPGGNGGLVLQIGDTADSFNQMSVAIEDMSAKGLGLDKLDISSLQSAKDAIGTIKNAINTVSTARAGMGALQNRLEHTINNLDVSVENLSAANSRIRDTDMAKEMMNYTKMNVLVQSAQAMLAQANQQPQSVLQLLQ